MSPTENRLKSQTEREERQTSLRSLQLWELTMTGKGNSGKQDLFNKCPRDGTILLTSMKRVWW